jgi:hypothetical protein
VKFFARYEYDYFRIIEAETSQDAFRRCAELDAKRPKGDPGISLETLENFSHALWIKPGQEFYAPEVGYWVRWDDPEHAERLLDSLVPFLRTQSQA